MSNLVHMGKPYEGKQLSFEDSLRNLAAWGGVKAFGCYFPKELTFGATVRDKYSRGVDAAPTCPVIVLGFLASYVSMGESGHSLSFEPRYAIVKKTGKTAKNLYLANYGPYASRGSICLATEEERLAPLIETSPFHELIERKQLAIAKNLAKHYRGDVTKTPISLDAEFTRNRFLEEAFRVERIQKMEARELAKQKVLEAASIHWTHFHGDLNAKFDGLMAGLEKGHQDATDLTVAEARAREAREEALQEVVQAWAARLESQRRTLAKF